MTLMVTIVEKRKQYEKKIVDTFFIIGPKKYLLIVIRSRKSFCLHKSNIGFLLLWQKGSVIKMITNLNLEHCLTFLNV